MHLARKSTIYICVCVRVCVRVCVYRERQSQDRKIEQDGNCS